MIVLHEALAAAGIDDTTAAQVRAALFTALIALATVAVGLAFIVGRSFARALGDVRAATLARARGDTTTALTVTTVAELDALVSAIARLSSRDADRDAALERERSEAALLLDAVSEGILRLDVYGRVVRANPAAQSMLGLSAAALGAPIATQVRHAELRRIVQQALAGTAAPAAELSYDDLRLVISAKPLAGGGAVIGLVDLTELRRLEGVRRDFVTNASHELKTPLTSIRGYVETLLYDDTLPTDTRRQFLDVVHKNAERLHHIVEDLLDLSRLESGGWRPELRAVDAVEVISDVWSSCNQRAAERHISFVPPCAPVWVQADPAGLRQVLANLFDNAIRYTPHGGRIEVLAHAPPQNGNGRAHVQFEVRDNGTGIPSDALPRIFERFYRVHPGRARTEGGTGLGLAIAKHLIESMGGDIGASSELGKGTIIRFRLPAAT